MGSTIAVALVSRGFPVILKDINDQAVNRGLETIDRLLKSRVEKGLAPSEAQKQREMIEPTTTYEPFANIDFAVEAVPELIAMKMQILQDLDQHCKAEAIFASNTSSLSITQLGAFTKRPDRVVGMHFFNPAHLMKLVEVIPGLETSPQTVATTIDFGRSLGKLAVRVEECASFLVNRLLGRYINEALYMLQEGAGTVEEIDKAACDYAMPIGPLALRDMNGADIGLAVARFNFEEYGERFLPATILEALVEHNLLGQKKLEGIYLYDAQTRKRTGPNPKLTELIENLTNRKLPRGTAEKHPHAQLDVERLFLPMINEAFLVIQEKICSIEDIDPALMSGLGMRKGPLAIASEIGLKNCLEKIQALNEQHGERFRPAPLLKRYVWASRKSVV
jgi:3-hydroxyacyl-CoA dehydrogenase